MGHLVIGPDDRGRAEATRTEPPGQRRTDLDAHAILQRMRGWRAMSVLWLALGGCSSPTPGAPRWDANVDAPRDDTGPIVGTGSIWTGGRAGGGGGGRTTPGCFAQLLVIFDRSGSMATVWEVGGASGPRWQLASDALTAAVEPLADRLEVGAILFPSAIEPGALGECSPVDPIEAQLDYREGPAFLSAWSALWSSPDVRGSTPIDSAFDSADAALEGSHTVTAVVLLTDGEPTCMGPVSAVDRAASWHARGIDTFVIGLPGTGGSGVLESIAAAGGTGSALSVDDPAALTAGLTMILGAQVDQACGG